MKPALEASTAGCVGAATGTHGAASVAGTLSVVAVGTGTGVGADDGAGDGAGDGAAPAACFFFAIAARRAM